MADKFERQLNQLKTDRKKLALLILALVVIVLWIGVSLFSSQKTVQLDKEIVQLSKPLVPHLDQQVFEELKNKKSYSDDDLRNFKIYRLRQLEEGDVILEIIDDDQVRLATNQAEINSAPVEQ